MNYIFLFLFLTSCASRGLLLSDQLPELNSEFKNSNLIGFIEEGEKLEKNNFKYLYKKKYSKLKRSIASRVSHEDENNKEVNKNSELIDFSSSFDFFETTIEDHELGILVN